jgi:predicted DNA-binding protein
MSKKYSWIGNRVDAEDMEKLHHLSKKVKKPITFLVRDAVKAYLTGGKHE